MFYYIPVWLFPLQSQESANELHCEENFQENQVERSAESNDQDNNLNFQISSDVWEAYLKIFEEELTILFQKQQKKVWTKEEDEILLRVREEEADWTQISNMIPGTNSEICRRRFNRMKHTNKKWPKQVDRQITRLYVEKRSKWSSIANAINENFNCRYKYTGKMIKERYEFYLREGICNNQWTVQEDIKLLREIRKNGRYWKNMLGKFEGRTELQLKNRFNGTLKLVQKRVIAKLRQSTQQKE